MRKLARITVAACLGTLGVAAQARAAGWGMAPAASEVAPPAAVPPPADPAPAAPAPPSDVAPASASSVARELLKAADAAIAAGNLGRAQGLFARIVWEHPGSPQASEARRALSVVELRDRSAAPAKRTSSASARAEVSPTQESELDSDSVVMREEPFSVRTSERLRLTAWEKLDFGVTSFLYGMSLGLTFSLSLTNPRPADVTMPIALGATLYTLGAIAYLKGANPDRGDLPLMLAITSYVPTTTLLVSNFLFENASEKKIAFATAGAGVASIPLAIAITQKLNLDPGDTQLVRDAGFWGLVTFTTATLGFMRETMDFGGGFSVSAAPSSRKVSGMGLLGLLGGLGLGTIAAGASEVSLERVRVATWGGYGGAILGSLIGASISGSGDVGAYKGITVGALTGLIITFIASSGLDGIPPADQETPRQSTLLRATPGLISLAGADGRSVPGLGIAGGL